MKKRLAAAVAGVLALAVLVISQPSSVTKVGPLSSGGFLLNSGWRLLPAGKQTPVDTFPMSAALSKDGRYLLVLNGGYNPPSISVLDVRTGAEVSRAKAEDAWLGLTFSKDGKKLYVGGGSRASVYEYNYADGKLEAARTFVVVPEGERKHQDFVGDVQFSPDGRLLYASVLYRDQIVVINPLSGRVIERFATGRRPYRILFHPDGKSFFVTSWADGSLLHHKADDGSILQRLRVGARTSDMVISSKKPEQPEGAEPLGYTHRIFITAGNTNRVYVVGLSEGAELRVVESINLAMTPRQPLGMTPSAMALTADEKFLHVVCSDANALAVVDIAESRSSVLGFVPTGWYPTAVATLPANRIAIVNGRGSGSYPNPKGPQPNKAAAKSHLGERLDQYVGSIQRGTVSWLDPIQPDQLAAYSKTVVANSPYRDELLDDAKTGVGNPVPSKPGDASPIEHVVYIVKENRTYDQMLGDLEKGNGDKSLTLFPEEVTPNHHKLAREFVLFDNFYVSADVSADGHNWSTAAIAPDYVQKMWPNSYAGRRKHYDYEGSDPASRPPAGYLWTNVASKGLTLRNYGYFADIRPMPVTDGIHVQAVRDSTLAPVTNRKYRAFDLDYPDVERAKVFLEDVAQFEKDGTMPRFLILRLGNDHTSGTSAGKIAPKAAVADNDHALGMIVEGLSKSRFWAKTAVFVLEDDAQNGPDHVDSHRSPAYVISPYTRRGVVDSTLYNTSSMLRTMELILGLNPMTMFDAGSRPMSAAFAAKPNMQPYSAERPRINVQERNPGGTASAARSAKMDFQEADQIDDDELNEILWLAIKKTDPPAPVRSYFSK